MNLEDIKDQVKERLAGLWGEIQENPTFNTLRERYETLSSEAQRGILWGIAGLIVLVLLSFPYSYFISSSDSMDSYENSKDTIRELLRVSRLNQNAPPVPEGLSPVDLRTRVQDALQGMDLLPEQIVGVSELAASGADLLARKPVEQSGVQVSLKQINLVQVLDIGHRLQNVSAGLKMAGLEMTSNPVKSGYFDVVFKIVSFTLPPPPEPASPPGTRRPGPGRRGGS